MNAKAERWKRFYESVQTMRRHQRAWFKYKATSELRKAKEAERVVDAIIAEIDEDRRQPKLFDDTRQS